MASAPSNVVFIDARVPDIWDLINGAQANTQVFVLDPAGGGQSTGPA